MQKEKPFYTYGDIQHWEGNWELIDGVPYLLASPSFEHQYVVGQLHLALASHFQARGCHVILAPFDVQLDPEEPERMAKTVVQPDLSVVCRGEQIGNRRMKGAPDLVVEVLSPSTALRDRNQKYYLYEKYGVHEYWMVDPSNRTIEVLSWQDGRFQQRAVFGPSDELVSFWQPDLTVSLAPVFPPEESDV
ncbi:endonuclease [Geobacillus thermocatenulatus]|uniref:Endonuclease n=1 Tax=Geobacillus thermocatenulatus TaxID=33938 RepID=A0A226Q3V9_9BACL|nr:MULTISPECIES: Uma2 family endonuclease [Geobacillus]ASS99848.1 endonuclease [Geobacillus thermocatenulatus]KLR72627.1 Uma2 family endonuclease [Geobacillus sp. T6]OXB86229.1 endonuclease [Geobacillus thermocatenulatus]RAN23391.1 Uma2 family Eendonuclease [Geobacillus sp. A8]